MLLKQARADYFFLPWSISFVVFPHRPVAEHFLYMYTNIYKLHAYTYIGAYISVKYLRNIL